MRDFLRRFRRRNGISTSRWRGRRAQPNLGLGFGDPVNTYYRFHDLDKQRGRRRHPVWTPISWALLGNLRYVADFMSRRRVRTTAEDAGKATMNRLYVVETAVTNTGAKADHRLALRASEIEVLARALAVELGVPDAPPATQLPDRVRQWVRQVAARKWILGIVAKDLRTRQAGARGLAGDRQPAAVHLLVHAINEHLGNVGHTVLHTDPDRGPAG